MFLHIKFGDLTWHSLFNSGLHKLDFCYIFFCYYVMNLYTELLFRASEYSPYFLVKCDQVSIFSFDKTPFEINRRNKDSVRSRSLEV